MQPQNATAERTMARLARASHGVVTRADLQRAGVTPEEIKQRLGRGALLRVHRGVFRVGHAAPSIEARYLAAVRACGEGALLSGRAAAHLLGLLKRPPAQPEVASAARRHIPGVTTRRARHMHPAEATIRRGIPTTTPARTLVDLAAVLDAAELARACHEAGVRHRTTPGDVEAVLSRRPNSSGATELRRIMRGDVRVTLSRLEAVFLDRLREAGLPLPVTNRLAGGRRVDCRWPDQRLTVELDGYRYHRSRHSWEQDRRREREARARDDEFRRFTYGDVLEEPRFMLAELRAVLGA